MKCILIDDDLIQQTLIEGYIEEMEGFEIVKSYSNPLDFMNDKSKGAFDILLLDMEMPKMSGVDLLDTIKKDFAVVVISSKKEYAIDVINHNVNGYLIKPIKFIDFMKMMEKIKTQIPVSKHTDNTNPETEHLFIKSNGMLHKLNFEEILYIGAAVDYIEVFTPNKKFLVNSSMNKIEEKLPKDQFYRIHRSTIVNINHISKIDHDYVEIGKNSLKIAPAKKDDFYRYVNKL